MDKKKIGIIAVSVIMLAIIGFGFNSIFSKANEKNSSVAESTGDKEASNKDKESSSEKNEGNDEEKKENEAISKDEKATDDKVSTNGDKSVADNKNDGATETDKESNSGDSNSGSVDSSKPEAGDKESVTTPPVVEKPDVTPPPVEEKPEPTPPPAPVEETVTIAISCRTAINSGLNNEAGFTHLPADGAILYETKVKIEEGDTVFDVLRRVTQNNGIHMEYTGSGGSIYIEGINNLYEFDGGQNSGWMYSVNGWYPNYGCGAYKVEANDVIQWNYTLDLGADLGAGVN